MRNVLPVLSFSIIYSLYRNGMNEKVTCDERTKERKKNSFFQRGRGIRLLMIILYSRLYVRLVFYINISKFYQFSWCWGRAHPSFASVYFLPDGGSLQKLTK
jgi:hypothetical protein